MHGKRCVEEPPGVVDFIVFVIVGDENDDSFESSAREELDGGLREMPASSSR